MKHSIIIITCSLSYLLLACVKDKKIIETKSTGANQIKQESLNIPAGNSVNLIGANWADARDNFVDGWVIPSGLTASDSYSVIQQKTNIILSVFQSSGANTVRLPINPPSVSGSWWGAYTGAIDEASTKGMKVILCCWESSASKDGRIDNTTLFWNMWQTVINKYGGNANVYFEVFNEPHGYTLTEISSVYNEFLNRYPNIPKGRILLSGTGYSEDVTQIGVDSRFNGCLLSIHDYSFFVNNSILTAAEWETRFRYKMGNYANRTVLTEFGAPMTTSKNYVDGINADGEKAYIQGMTNVCRFDGVSSVYWPGLRDNDSYSLYTFNGSAMSLTNPSGLSRIQYGWGIGNGGTDNFYSNAYYRIINRNSEKLVDVNQASKANGANIVQWPGNGGNNQQWQILDIGGGFYKFINRNSGLAMDVNQASTVNGAQIIQWPFNGGANQQWQTTSLTGGFTKIINKNSGEVLDVNGGVITNGASIIQWPWNGGNNQQWLVIQQ